MASGIKKDFGEFGDQLRETETVEEARELLGIDNTESEPDEQTISASPYIYTNTSGRVQVVVISGGAVSIVEISKDVSTFYPAGLLSGTLPLGVGMAVRITYVVTPPTVTVITL